MTLKNTYPAGISDKVPQVPEYASEETEKEENASPMSILEYIIRKHDPSLAKDYDEGKNKEVIKAI